MAKYTVQKRAVDGFSPTFDNAAGLSGAPDTFSNNQRTVLRVKNGGAAAVDVTIIAQKACEQGFLHDLTGSVPAGGDETFGPFDRHYMDGSTTEVYYSDVTSVTVAAIDES